MTEEQPPAPSNEPEALTSSAAASEPASVASTDPPRAPQSQTLRSLQELWRTTQPGVKASTVTVLKTIITALEKIVIQLEATPAATTVDDSRSATSAPPAPTWLNQLWYTLQTGWQTFWRWWRGMLPRIRGVLPTAFHETLSDRALTGAIAGVLLLVLWVGSSLFSSPPPKQVAVVPPPQSSPAKPTPPRAKATPQPQPEVKALPQPNPSPAPSPNQPIAPPNPAPPPVSLPAPVASPVPVPLPTPAPPPLKLTPEQTLIAQIQDQVAEVSDQYVNGLIQAVQANFRASRLTVKVGEGWYSLLPLQQDRLANDVLKRAQQLNFVKLEVTDTNGRLLARSPVVGAEMVVLQRAAS